MKQRRIGRPPATYTPTESTDALLDALRETTKSTTLVRETAETLTRYRAQLVHALGERGVPALHLAKALGVSPASITRLRRLAETTGEDDR